MRNDAISRQLAISVITAYNGKSAQIDALEKLQCVEPKRPKGHWKIVPSYDSYGEYRPRKYECSECGWMIDLCRGLRQEQGFRLFCEHCGADMR